MTTAPAEPASASALATAAAVETTAALNAFPVLAAEESFRDHQAEEAVFLTFNVDLGWFEARLLGIMRATGARVTVMADAGVWAPDARAIRHAGRSYHVGLVQTSGAFHPKVALVVGPKRALAVVGSGNLTLGGWQYNAELLTVFKGDKHAMPTAFTDIHGLLASLASSGRLDPYAASAIERAGTILKELIDTTAPVDTGHRVYGSWDEPLINHLPTGPVEEVLLSAAFHDPDSEAIRRILQRMQPERVRVSVQPGWTYLDPIALRRVLHGYQAGHPHADVAVVADIEPPGVTDSRYRHGKLIEWRADGQRFAMTGSANLSVAALLNPAPFNGNHEVAVVGPLPRSLFPGTATPIDWAHPELDTATTDPEEEAASAITGNPRLAFAIRSPTGVHLMLVQDASHPVHVQVSHRADSPDEYLTIATIPTGARNHDIYIDLAGGSRVRLNWTDPLTGAARISPTMFVTDATRVNERAIPTGTKSRTYQATAADLFSGDLTWLNTLSGELVEYAKDVASAKGPMINREGTKEDRAAGAGESNRGSALRWDEPDEWLWLQNDTVRQFGPGFAGYALALPLLDTRDTGGLPWLDRITGDEEIGLEGDTAEALEATDDDTPEAVEPDTQVIDHSSSSDRLKADRRRWAAKAAQSAPLLSIPSRLLILRVTLAFWTAGNWPDNDPAPHRLVARLVQALDQTGTPTELERRIGSLAAVAITLTRQRVDLSSNNEAALAYRALLKESRHLLIAAEPDLIAEYSRGLRNPYGSPLDPDEVIDFAALVTADDPLGDLHRDMEDKGWTVTRPAPRLMRIHGEFSGPAQIALEATGTNEDVHGIGIWATNDKGEWVLVVWRKPDLVTIDTTGGRPTRWRHQILPPHIGPAVVARAVRQAEPYRWVQTLPGSPGFAPTPAARAVVTAVGITDIQPPP